MKEFAAESPVRRSGLWVTPLVVAAMVLGASPAMAAKFSLKNCGSTNVSVIVDGKGNAEALPTGGSTVQMKCGNETCSLAFISGPVCHDGTKVPDKPPGPYLVKYSYQHDASGSCTKQRWDFIRGDDCALMKNY
ncbi:MAG: hypothetical protein GC201_03965 [Alphaproteobacteria bacterium]|nr:hypothetical protein [Alphaproteobacteria bacterium]